MVFASFPGSFGEWRQAPEEESRFRRVVRIEPFS